MAVFSGASRPERYLGPRVSTGSNRERGLTKSARVLYSTIWDINTTHPPAHQSKRRQREASPFYQMIGWLADRWLYEDGNLTGSGSDKQTRRTKPKGTADIVLRSPQPDGKQQRQETHRTWPRSDPVQMRTPSNRQATNQTRYTEQTEAHMGYERHHFEADSTLRPSQAVPHPGINPGPAPLNSGGRERKDFMLGWRRRKVHVF